MSPMRCRRYDMLLRSGVLLAYCTAIGQPAYGYYSSLWPLPFALWPTLTVSCAFRGVSSIYFSKRYLENLRPQFHQQLLEDARKRLEDLLQIERYDDQALLEVHSSEEWAKVPVSRFCVL